MNLLVSVVIFPILMITFGSYLKQGIQYKSLIGYRTYMSLKSIDVWNYAQAFAGNVFQKVGMIFTVLSCCIYTILCVVSPSSLGLVFSILTIIMLISFGGCMIYIEMNLRKHFDQKGKKKI